MRAIAVVLLLGVFLRNFSIFGGMWDASSFSPQAIFYMLGGILELILFSVIAVLVWKDRKSYWGSIVIIASVMGMIEGFTTTGCRLLISDIFALPRDIHMCDWKFGFSFQGWRLTFYLIYLASWGLWGYKNANKSA